MGNRVSPAAKILGCVSCLQFRLLLDILLPTSKVRVRSLDRSSNSIESQTGRLCRELHLASNVEESKISRNQVMRHTSRFIQNINLSADHILGFLASIV
jgi:hypothetical protein